MRGDSKKGMAEGLNSSLHSNARVAADPKQRLFMRPCDKRSRRSIAGCTSLRLWVLAAPSRFYEDVTYAAPRTASQGTRVVMVHATSLQRSACDPSLHLLLLLPVIFPFRFLLVPPLSFAAATSALGGRPMEHDDEEEEEEDSFFAPAFGAAVGEWQPRGETVIIVRGL
eukprot:GHVU01069954.1.p1 GENE.GHVU01069954.1~~GHVU01069954.1.p1  ORF type:complete len:169 (+),score=23.16 GHVU01069954.1:126-632(+)